jgi:sortase B
MMKKLSKLCVVVLAVGVLFSAWQVTSQLMEYQQGADSYDQVREIADGEESKFQSAIDFDALRELNSDVVAWLRCDGTVLDYPIVQTADNETYLHIMFDGTEYKQGCPFLDCGNSPDFSDQNSVIYGHHMKDGSMFAVISQYKEQGFYEEHPTMQLYTPTADYEVLLFAGGVFHNEDDVWRTAFSDQTQWEQWLELVQRESRFSSQVQPVYGQRILTLSTCSYEFENAKFVLFGVLNGGE